MDEEQQLESDSKILNAMKQQEVDDMAQYMATISLWRTKGACPFCHRWMPENGKMKNGKVFTMDDFIDHVGKTHL